MSASHPGEPPPPIPNNPFKISIRTATQTLQLEVLYTTTVRELKALIESSANNPEDLKNNVDGRMHLMLNPGEDLENYLSSDDFLLGREGVQEGSTVAVVTKPLITLHVDKDERCEYRLT